MSEPKPPVIHGTVVERLVNARRMPVVPAWIRDDVTRRAAAKYAVRHVSHLAAFHGARSPKYLARTVAHSPRGLVRTGRRLTHWLADGEGAPLRSAAVAKGDHDAYMKLSKQRNQRVQSRTTIAATAGLPLAAGLAAGVLFVGVALWLPLAIVAVFVLGYLGRPLDRVWLDVPLSGAPAEKLTPDIVVRALTKVGIAGMTKPDGIKFAPGQPICRDGPGWLAQVDTPEGITALDVMERRDRLASALRRPLGCVWPEGDSGAHPGRLRLWVGDQDMRKATKPWPLAKSGQVDLFQPVPFAMDQRGRTISVLLMFASVLIGAMPRMGKTFALRILALAAALCPIAEIRAFELKGTGDLACLEHVAHDYGCGADDGTLADCLASLRQVYEVELIRRAETIRRLPTDLRPENKVTPQLAAKRSLGLHPLVFIIDECQEAFSHPTHKDEFDRYATAITKRGPALGIILLLATQRPDAKSLPTGISSNIGIRFCLRVMGQPENDMVLGTSSHKNGIRATTFVQEDKGIGWLSGHADDAQVVKGFMADAPAAEAIALRARKLREAAGTLSGYAAGQASDRGPAVSLLADVISVLGAEDKQHSRVLCERLAELRPGLYGGWDATALANALRGYGVETGQVWANGSNSRGVTAEALREAMAGQAGPAVSR